MKNSTELCMHQVNLNVCKNYLKHDRADKNMEHWLYLVSVTNFLGAYQKMGELAGASIMR